MKTIHRFSLILIIIVIAAFVLPGPALAAPHGKMIVGGLYTLTDGEMLNEDLVLIGGMATLNAGSQVNGDILVMGGSLYVDGSVNGDITATGGLVQLSESAVVQGDVSTFGATLDRDSGAVISGEIRDETSGPIMVSPGPVSIPNVNMHVNPFVAAGWYILRAILWALLAMLLIMFIPSLAENTAQAVTTQPLIAGGLGLLTIVVAPLVLLILIISICLIPVALVGLLMLALAWVFGLIAIGMELGKRFGRMFKQEWHPALAAGLGTLLLILLLNGLNLAIPCIGWIPQVLVGMVGLGGVLMTRYGTVDYPSTITSPPTQASTPLDTPG